MTVDQMIDDIIRREGGYVNHPKDRGGPTKYGITQKTLSAWPGVWSVPEGNVKNITEDDARDIYREEYYVRPGIAKLPPALQPFIFDCAVNHGPIRAVKFLQNVLRELGHAVAIDGKIGPKTCHAAIMAIAKHGERIVLTRLIEHRRTFYLAIVDRDPSQNVFLKGWLNRLAEFERVAAPHATLVDRLRSGSICEPDLCRVRDARSCTCCEAADALAAAQARIAELEALLAERKEGREGASSRP